MRLIPWSESNHPFLSLQRQVNRLFDDWTPGEWLGEKAWAPALDVEETKDNILVRAEIPGIDPKEVAIEVLGDTLTLRGEKREEKESTEKNWHRVERRYGSFARTVQLPCAVDPEKAAAKAKDGVLTISLAKKETSKARRINVRAD